MAPDRWPPPPHKDGSGGPAARLPHVSPPAPPPMTLGGPPVPPLRATTPPARGHATYTWDRLTPPQQEAVWELLRTDQTHRVARAARRRLVVLLSVVVLLLVALGLILFLLVSGALWLY